MGRVKPVIYYFVKSTSVTDSSWCNSNCLEALALLKRPSGKTVSLGWCSA